MIIVSPYYARGEIVALHIPGVPQFFFTTVRSLPRHNNFVTRMSISCVSFRLVAT